MTTATALANPNIALIKYWGNRDQEQRLPANGSISINLDSLHTRTQVTFEPEFEDDRLEVNGQDLTGPALLRVSRHLDLVREMSGVRQAANVVSENNFPMGAGIASSASAFAALTLAASAAAGLLLDERELSRLARRGSGSACRSIPGGFVEWQPGTDDESSFACSLAPADHWELVDCLVIVSRAHKPTGSTQGHALADTSVLQPARVADTPRRLAICRQAIQERDFAALSEVVELDSNLMHAVMLTSTPPLHYWQPETLEVMHALRAWRVQGTPACYTIDAGPNVHVICPKAASMEVASRLRALPGVLEVLTASPGGPARLLDSPEIPE